MCPLNHNPADLGP